jgi:adenine-specific DNA-methyltransferase
MNHSQDRKAEPVRQSARRLRRDSTGPERALWEVVRNRNLARLNFRRQHPIGPYIVDFFCQEHQLAIELDGDSHIERAEYDARRQRYIEHLGIRVLRIGNDDVLEDLEAVCRAILDACGKRLE